MGDAKRETFDFISPLSIGAVDDDEGEVVDAVNSRRWWTLNRCLRAPVVQGYRNVTAAIAVILVTCALFAFMGVGSGPGNERRVPVQAADLEAWALPRASCGGPGVPKRFVLGERNASAALACEEQGLGWEAWFALAVTLSTLAALISGAPPDLAMLSATGIFRLADIVPAHDTWRGFSSTSIIALAELYVVAAAVRKTGIIAALVRLMLGHRTSTPRVVLFRLVFPIATLSALTNNPPVVAMFQPVVQDWADERDLDPGLLLLPLAYATILGGTTTLLGTSTNVILQGLVEEQGGGLPPPTMFTVTPVSAPVAAVGLLLIVLLGPSFLQRGRGTKAPIRPLPEHSQAKRRDQAAGHRFELFYEVEPRSPLCGILLSESAVVRTVGASVSEVVRREEGEGERARGRTYQFGEGAPFSPEAFVLRGGDELRVRCTASQAAALRRGKAPGLRILNESARLLEQLWERRCVVEVVVGRECALRGAPIPLAGHTWLQHYSACPLGLVRPSQPIPAGDHAPAARQRRRSSVLLTAKPRRGSSRPGGATRAAAQPRSVLEVGDVVLLETHAAFSAMHGGGSGDFVLVREVDAGLGSRAQGPHVAKSCVAVATVVAMVCVNVLGVLRLEEAALAAIAVLLATRCITVQEAYHAVNARVILAVVSAFGVASAFTTTGLAGAAARALVRVGSVTGPFGALSCLGVATSLLSCVITPNPSAILLFPVARDVRVAHRSSSWAALPPAYRSILANCPTQSVALTAPAILPQAAQALSADGVQFASVLSVLQVSAALGLASPVGNQPNIMAAYAGGYRFLDYILCGLPLQLVLILITVWWSLVVF